MTATIETTPEQIHNNLEIGSALEADIVESLDSKLVIGDESSNVDSNPTESTATTAASTDISEINGTTNGSNTDVTGGAGLDAKQKKKLDKLAGKFKH